jgi:hypothetical protein
MKLAVFLTGLFCSFLVYAGQTDAIHTCYDKKMATPSDAIETALFVVIDQTTLLDLKLKQLVADNIKPFLLPGNSFSIVTFSAYTQGHYTELIVSGKLDAELDPATRNDISKPVLVKFDRCMNQQLPQSAQLVGGALRAAYENTANDIAKSDVLAGIKAISPMVQNSKARSKVVLIVSDMLENSSITSFYSDKGQSVRKIDPAKELKLVEENRLFGNFEGARVYVVGAGLLGEDGQKAKRYRDPKTMQSLSSFWKSYFDKSNGQLVEFGEPALLNPIH